MKHKLLHFVGFVFFHATCFDKWVLLWAQAPFDADLCSYIIVKFVSYFISCWLKKLEQKKNSSTDSLCLTE